MMITSAQNNLAKGRIAAAYPPLQSSRFTVHILSHLAAAHTLVRRGAMQANDAQCTHLEVCYNGPGDVLFKSAFSHWGFEPTCSLIQCWAHTRLLSKPKRRLDLFWFSHFCTAHTYLQHRKWHADTQTQMCDMWSEKNLHLHTACRGCDPTILIPILMVHAVTVTIWMRLH